MFRCSVSKMEMSPSESQRLRRSEHVQRREGEDGAAGRRWFMGTVKER